MEPQRKNEATVMKTFARSRGPVYLGLDVHKDSITAGSLLVTASTPVLSRFATDDASVRQLLAKCGDPKDVRVYYEAGPTGFELAPL
jgi:hypothetical protein